jgi:hypothetical protein
LHGDKRCEKAGYDHEESNPHYFCSHLLYHIETIPKRNFITLAPESQIKLAKQVLRQINNQ